VDRPAIDVQRLRASLGARWVRAEVVAQTASTNTDLLDNPAAPDGSVLVAEYQSAGRGRLDRPWTSPPRAGLTFSVLLHPQTPIATWGWLPLLAGVAIREGVVAVTGVDVALKWPNDLLAGPQRKKIAGILVQTQAQTAAPACVIGCGLNVTNEADELPTEQAGSLALCGARDVDRTALLGTVLDRLDAWLGRWYGARGDAEVAGLLAAYRGCCATLGQDVLVHAIDGAVLRGTAVDIDRDGRLRVDTTTGERAVGAGDVEHVRPG
jgi:BirA family biotin operon repressor/biotin-[acetyl-CoA-carboxylase] ligase